MIWFKEKQASNFDEMTLLYRRFLRLFAILPFEGQDYTSPITRALLAVTLVSSVINWSMFVVHLLTAGVPAIDTICETVVVVGFNTRYYLLLWQRHEFADLLEEGRQIWSEYDEERRRQVQPFERKVRILFVCLLSNSLFGHGLYTVSAVALNLVAAHNNQGNDTCPQHFLPYKWYASGGEDFWPGYKYNFTLQVVLVTIVSIMASIVDSAAPLLIMIGAGYFRALQHRLHQLSDIAHNSEDELRADRELVACLRLHQRILNYCSRINKITRTLFFVLILTTVYNISLLGIKLSGTDPDKLKYLPVCIFNLSQLLICQWAPDHLINESVAISSAAYSVSVPWMRRRMGKLLVLIIARAQRPVQMTAAGVVYLSLENFGAMLKGAASFFTVARSFTV